MLLETKRDALIEDDRIKKTNLSLSYNDVEVLMEALSFAKNVYAKSALTKKGSLDPEDQKLAYNHEYSSLLIEELIEKIVKEGRLIDYGGVIH